METCSVSTVRGVHLASTHFLPGEVWHVCARRARVCGGRVRTEDVLTGGLALSRGRLAGSL